MGTVTFRVTNVPSRAAAARQVLPSAVVAGQECSLKSPLSNDLPFTVKRGSGHTQTDLLGFGMISASSLSRSWWAR